MDFTEGEILYVDKPFGWTSFDVVNKIRWQISRTLKIKKVKVGHAGTLDPLATGVMIICTGKATKRIEEFQYQTKEYIATLELGATTELIDKVLPSFTGEIWQVPPMYSAVKVEGKRAYKYAREGQEVELKPKLLVIDEIEVLDFSLPVLKIRVVCSKGTYLRALARDIGEALQSGAHLTALQRTRIGDVRLENCWQMGDLLNHISGISGNEKQVIPD